MKVTRNILLLIVIVAIVSISVTSVVSIMLSRLNDHYLPSLAVIKTIEVETYWDADCTNKTTVIDWGETKPGIAIDKTLYIKSISNFRVTLNLNVTNWSPPDISDYITITWNYNGATLEPGEAIPVTMNLSASSSNDFVDYLIENEITEFSVELHFVPS